MSKTASAAGVPLSETPITEPAPSHPSRADRVIPLISSVRTSLPPELAIGERCGLPGPVAARFFSVEPATAAGDVLAGFFWGFSLDSADAAEHAKLSGATATRMRGFEIIFST